MNLFFMRLGRLKSSTLITFLSVFLSLVFTSWLQAFLGRQMGLENILPALLAPLLIAAPISWYVLGMLFHIHHLEQKMRALAMRDPLTNLYNRRFFYEYMEKWVCIAGRVEKPFVIVLIDIDHFKKVNDEFGHEAGDLVIQHVASVLSSNLRRSDIICRFGGEEYAIGLINVEIEIAKVIMEKIRHLIEKTSIHYKGKDIFITVSAGVKHQIHGQDANLDHLLHQADVALYQAKNAGRNRICLH